MIKKTNSSSYYAPALQFLRFCAFLLIFQLHIGTWGSADFPSLNGSNCAVSFFFILSGTVSAYSSINKDINLNIKSVISTIWHKLKRIYPLYFLTTIYSIWLSQVIQTAFTSGISSIKNDIIQLAKNLLLMQSWFTYGNYSYNGVGWFISSLMLSYALLVPIQVAVHRINKSPSKIAINVISIISVLGLILCYNILIERLSVDRYYWIYIFPISRLGEFIFGFLVGNLILICQESISPNNSSSFPYSCFEIISILCIFFFLFHIKEDSFSYYTVAWLIPNAIIITAFSIGKGIISKIISTKPFLFLGSISFECYLIHQLIIRQYQVNIPYNNISLSWRIFSASFCLLLTIITATLFSKELRPK